MLQWHETGSVQVKARTRRNTIRSPENIQCVRIALERSTLRSVRRHSQLLNLSDRSVQRTLHYDLHFHPYKLQIVQELTAAHKALGVRFCQQIVHTHADLGRFLNWPSNSPDLTAADFFMGVFESSSLYSHHP